MKAQDLPGKKVVRKDGATGSVISIGTAIPTVAHPGPFGKTLVTVRYDDPEIARAAGGDSVGDLSWFRSNFKVVQPK